MTGDSARDSVGFLYKHVTREKELLKQTIYFKLNLSLKIGSSGNSRPILIHE